MPLAAYQGKVQLVVNTASFCGFTWQFNGLQALHERYERKGRVLIGVPANDFGDQEPGSNAEIARFCQGAFNITFPLASKETVTGAAAHPSYRWHSIAGSDPCSVRVSCPPGIFTRSWSEARGN